MKQQAEAVLVLELALTGQELYRFALECEGRGALKAAPAMYQSQKARADSARAPFADGDRGC